MFNFPLTKSSQQRKTARHCKTDEKLYCQYWILRLLFLLDFPRTEIAWWNSICYLDQLEQFLLTFAGKNVSRLGLLHMINWGCCENIVLLC